MRKSEIVRQMRPLVRPYTLLGYNNEDAHIITWEILSAEDAETFADVAPAGLRWEFAPVQGEKR